MHNFFLTTILTFVVIRMLFMLVTVSLYISFVLCILSTTKFGAFQRKLGDWLLHGQVCGTKYLSVYYIASLISIYMEHGTLAFISMLKLKPTRKEVGFSIYNVMHVVVHVPGPIQSQHVTFLSEL